MMVTLLLKNLLFTFLVPGTVAVYLPFWLTADTAIHSGWSAVLGIPVLATGGFIYAWCVWDFATFGRGTPAPIDAPSKLVISGLYQYTRNPMYVGVLSVILGWATLWREPVLLIYAAGLFTVFHLFVIVYEERTLARTFGPEYDEYCVRVGRWLPRWSRRAAS